MQVPVLYESVKFGMLSMSGTNEMGVINTRHEEGTVGWSRKEPLKIPFILSHFPATSATTPPKPHFRLFLFSMRG